MKIYLRYRLHEPSPSFTALIHERLESIAESLQIDEAHVMIARRPEASPAFQVSMHLVTPGPDVLVEAVDHTLRAAFAKAIRQLEARISRRDRRRALVRGGAEMRLRALPAPTSAGALVSSSKRHRLQPAR
jgi:ribosome-associated translation inhibitor RaiA